MNIQQWFLGVVHVSLTQTSITQTNLNHLSFKQFSPAVVFPRAFNLIRTKKDMATDVWNLKLAGNLHDDDNSIKQD